MLVAHHAIAIDEEDRAFHPEQPPRAEEARHFSLGITEQAEGQRPGVAETPMRLGIVRRDPDHLDAEPGKGFDAVAVITQLRGADRSLIARVKDQQETTPARLAEPEGPTILVGKGEVGGGFSEQCHAVALREAVAQRSGGFSSPYSMGKG